MRPAACSSLVSALLCALAGTPVISLLGGCNDIVIHSPDGGGGDGGAGGKDLGGFISGDMARRDGAAPGPGPSDFASGTPAPQVNLTFSGCTPDFSANLIVVTNNGSMAVTRSDFPAEGQVQLHLTKTFGSIAVSTSQRVATGDVINILDGVTWTNISSTTPDPIKGTLTINDYDEQAGIADLVFSGVVVENVSTHALCTINGTLQAQGKTF
jgi:hypothetical protein